MKAPNGNRVKLIEVKPNKYIYHTSNPFFRDKISKEGLIPKGRDEATWLSDTQIDGEVIFATNGNIEDVWDSGYDDDIYRIDTTNLKNKWYKDPNFVFGIYANETSKAMITFEPIPKDYIELIHEGNGESKDSNTDIRYSKGGLIAPNGNPSNLTTEQYKLVRTPAFKNWFGDWENDPANASKVVDENGEPLVVYHGTNKKINVFDKNLEGLKTNRVRNLGNKSIYFTSNRNVAETYGKKVYPVFLDLRNPSIIFANGQHQTKIKDKQGENVIIYDVVDYYNSGVPTQIWSKFENTEEFYKFYTSNVYAVGNPNQIKLADGTNTTFDSKNDDIKFMSGGALNDEKYKLFREEFFTHLIAGKLGNIKGFSEKNGNKDINDLAIEISLLNQQHKAYEKGRDIIGKLYLLAKKIDENTGLKTSKGITYNYIIKRDIFSIKELYDKIDEEALPLFNELADGSNTTFDGSNPDIRYSKGGQIKYFEYTIGGL